MSMGKIAGAALLAALVLCGGVRQPTAAENRANIRAQIQAQLESLRKSSGMTMQSTTACYVEVGGKKSGGQSPSVWRYCFPGFGPRECGDVCKSLNNVDWCKAAPRSSCPPGTR